MDAGVCGAADGTANDRSPCCGLAAEWQRLAEEPEAGITGVSVAVVAAAAGAVAVAVAIGMVWIPFSKGAMLADREARAVEMAVMEDASVKVVETVLVFTMLSSPSRLGTEFTSEVPALATSSRLQGPSR